MHMLGNPGVYVRQALADADLVAGADDSVDFGNGSHVKVPEPIAGRVGDLDIAQVLFAGGTVGPAVLSDDTRADAVNDRARIASDVDAVVGSVASAQGAIVAAAMDVLGAGRRANA